MPNDQALPLTKAVQWDHLRGRRGVPSAAHAFRPLVSCVCCPKKPLDLPIVTPSPDGCVSHLSQGHRFPDFTTAQAYHRLRV